MTRRRKRIISRRWVWFSICSQERPLLTRWQPRGLTSNFGSLIASVLRRETNGWRVPDLRLTSTSLIYSNLPMELTLLEKAKLMWMVWTQILETTAQWDTLVFSKILHSQTPFTPKNSHQCLDTWASIAWVVWTVHRTVHRSITRKSTRRETPLPRANFHFHLNSRRSRRKEHRSKWRCLSDDEMKLELKLFQTTSF